MKHIILIIIAATSLALCTACHEEKDFLVIACISMPKDTIVLGDPIDFENCSSFAEEYKWYYTLNSVKVDSSTLSTPSYTFAKKGRYAIILKAYNTGEGADSTFTYLVVEEPEAE